MFHKYYVALKATAKPGGSDTLRTVCECSHDWTGPEPVINGRVTVTIDVPWWDAVNSTAEMILCFVYLFISVCRNTLVTVNT